MRCDDIIIKQHPSFIILLKSNYVENIAENIDEFFVWRVLGHGNAVLYSSWGGNTIQPNER